MPKPLQPNFILDVEMSELFIQAGLQDRVIQASFLSRLWLIGIPTFFQSQVYEGLVYMDFDKSLMEERGYGK